MVNPAISKLDLLASNGVIDFDAGAYMMGTTPRYVGNPSLGTELPLDRPLPAWPVYKLPAQPSADAFISKDTTVIKEKSWKNALAGVIVAGLAIFTGLKLKSKISALFKKKPVIPPAIPPVGTTPILPPKKGIGKAFEKLSKAPKWLKISGAIALGLSGLYGAYRVATKKGTTPTPTV